MTLTELPLGRSAIKRGYHNVSPQPIEVNTETNTKMVVSTVINAGLILRFPAKTVVFCENQLEISGYNYAIIGSGPSRAMVYRGKKYAIANQRKAAN